MRLYDLAETVAELAGTVARLSDLMGYEQSAAELRGMQAELERDISLIEAREMVGEAF